MKYRETCVAAERYRRQRNPLRIERSGSGFIVSDSSTGVFGFGRDPLSALRDQVIAVEEHRNVEGRQ